MARSNIKRTIYVAIALFMGISLLILGMNSETLQAEETQTSPKETFDMTAQEIADEIVFGWNLGNTLDADNIPEFTSEGLTSEISWYNPYTTQEMIDLVASTGINAVRLPITWHNHMDPETYEIDEEWLDRVEEVVNYVISNDMYCIINVHHDTGSNGWLKASYSNYKKNAPIFEKIWEQISEHFIDYNEKLLFEGFNEILDEQGHWEDPTQEGLAVTNDYNQLFVDTVRKSGGNNAQRVLVCNTYAANGNSFVTGGWNMPNDPAKNKIMAQCHIYEPYYFVSWYEQETTTWKQDKASLDAKLNALKTNFVDKGVPVIIGEFNTNPKDNMDEVISWADYYVKTATNYGIKCFWWDTNCIVDLFSRNTLQIVQENLLNTMLARAKGEIPKLDANVKGDANDDGLFNVADVVMLQKWLVGAGELIDPQNVDLCKDNVINVFDLCLLKRKLIEQSNLGANLNKWICGANIVNGAEAEVEYLNNGISVTAKRQGSSSEDIMASYVSLPFYKGETYQISFDYTSTIDLPVTFFADQHWGSEKYFQDTFDCTDKVQHYEGKLTMKSVNTSTRLLFNLGNDTDDPYTVTITNLKVIKITDNNVINGKNLCQDPENWYPYTYDDHGEAEMTKTNNGVKTEVTKSGEQGWYVQSIYGGLTLEKGAKYRIEFDYSSTFSGTFTFCVQQNYDPYGQYFLKNLNYSGKTQHFSADFTMTEDDDNVSVIFNGGGMGSVSPFTMTISNLSLIRIS